MSYEADYQANLDAIEAGEPIGREEFCALEAAGLLAPHSFDAILDGAPIKCADCDLTIRFRNEVSE